jgi:6-phosphogluconolactonase/glucosamine-6-phosphate isomerase/deaminase
MIAAVVGFNVVVDDDPSRAAAEEIAIRLRAALAERDRATLAVSGGSTGRDLLVALATAELSWDDITIWQVDERVAPDGDPARNANQLDGVPGRHVLMPVTEPDLAAAAAAYAAGLPDHFDVVHLGMGPDGHTASWPPGDPVIDSTAPVALSQPYQGHVRMTLTPPIVNGAGARVVLIVGADKAAAVAGWLAGEIDLPICRVRADDTIVVLDPPAAAEVRS